MNRPSNVFGVSRIYWNQGWRTARRMMMDVPRATNSIGVWIHTSPLLVETELVDMMLLGLLFTLTSTILLHALQGGISSHLEALFFCLLFSGLIHSLSARNPNWSLERESPPSIIVTRNPNWSFRYSKARD